MKICRKLVVGFGLSILFALTASAADDRFWSASLGLTYFGPDESKAWDDAAGGELALKRWVTEDFGLGLHLGLSTWDLATSTGSGRAFSGAVSGDADIMNIGGSFLYRSPMNKAKTVHGILDIGIELLQVDANGTFKATAADGSQHQTGLDSSDGANFRFLVDLEREFNNGFVIFGGLGYTFNLNTPGVGGRIDTGSQVFESKEMTGFSSDRSTDGYILRAGIRKFF